MSAAVPTQLKMVRGTARRDRANPGEPQPPALEVGTKPPSWLKGPRRQQAWRELVELLRDQRLLTVLDTAALALLVDAYGDYLEASDVVQGTACGLCGRGMSKRYPCTAPGEWIDVPNEAGEPVHTYVPQEHVPGRRLYSTRTREGSLMIRPHPAVAIRQDAWKRVVTMLARFGMEPSSRSKVSAAGDESADPMADLLEDVG